MMDTIFALATPEGRSALQIIRISGGESSLILEKMVGYCPKPRLATHAKITLDGQPVDDSIILFFKSPASATGEDMAELHLHGSHILGRILLEWLETQSRCRLADRGEFTRRAFLNGKINLDQAEGLADLIDADTTIQHKQALRQLNGALSDATEDWRHQIIALSSQLEALIDFADEDLPNDLAQQIFSGISSLSEAMEQSLSTASQGLIMRDGFKIALLGRPNAGKSTLLNRLVGDERAIVSAEAGTTRDLIQVSLDLDGIAVHLTDTAGLRHDGLGSVEEEGIKRAIQAAHDAQLVLMLIDSQDDVTATHAELCKSLVDFGEMPEILPILTKGDLLKKNHSLPEWPIISAETGVGMADLDRLIKDRITTQTGEVEAPLLTRHRHITAIRQAVQALSRASTLNFEANPELLAEEFRLAATSLGRISGRVDVEDLLDQIFSNFCIGK